MNGESLLIALLACNVQAKDDEYSMYRRRQRYIRQKPRKEKKNRSSLAFWAMAEAEDTRLILACCSVGRGFLFHSWAYHEARSAVLEYVRTYSTVAGGAMCTSTRRSPLPYDRCPLSAAPATWPCLILDTDY